MQGKTRCFYLGSARGARCGFASWWLFLSLSESAGVFIYVFKYLVGSGEEEAKPGTPPGQAAALAQAADAGLDPQAPRGNAETDLGIGWGFPSWTGVCPSLVFLPGTRRLKACGWEGQMNLSQWLKAEERWGASPGPL